MNWKQILGITVGVVFILAMVMIYVPSESDELTGAFSWKGLFTPSKERVKIQSVGDVAPIKADVEVDEDLGPCDYLGGDKIALNAGEAISVGFNNITFLKASTSMALLEFNDQYYTKGLGDVISKEGVSICVDAVYDELDPSEDAVVLVILEDEEESLFNSQCIILDSHYLVNEDDGFWYGKSAGSVCAHENKFCVGVYSSTQWMNGTYPFDYIVKTKLSGNQDCNKPLGGAEYYTDGEGIYSNQTFKVGYGSVLCCD